MYIMYIACTQEIFRAPRSDFCFLLATRESAARGGIGNQLPFRALAGARRCEGRRSGCLSAAQNAYAEVHLGERGTGEELLAAIGRNDATVKVKVGYNGDASLSFRTRNGGRERGAWAFPLRLQGSFLRPGRCAAAGLALTAPVPLPPGFSSSGSNRSRDESSWKDEDERPTNSCAR
jgi:hypothetical protein